MTTASPTRGSRATSAVKAVLRYAHRQGLAAGDRLPPQQDLRGALGFSNDTLTAAMRTLVDAGVLHRKSKAGTVVADLSATVPNLWSVAILVPPAQEMIEVPFFAQLMHFLQSHFRQVRHDCRVYPSQGPWRHDLGRLDDFPGLSEQVQASHVDAVLTTFHGDTAVWNWARERQIPVCHVWWYERAPLGVIIDQKPMVTAAARRLAGEGCGRLAVVSQSPPGRGGRRFADGFEEALRALPVRSGGILHAGPGAAAGYALAEQLIARAAEERPDGLIVIDDRIAMGLTAGLAARSDYRPRIAVHANRQAPLYYALPVIRFEIDIEQLAAMAVHLLAQRLLTPDLPDRLDLYCSVPPGRGER